jgi:Hemerythrin HHE cation binding domain
MASLDPTFRLETASIHREHEELIAQLDRLDAALDELFCFSEIFSDMATANQAAATGRLLAEWLPKHYAHEETTVLATIAQMGPELASFTREMQRQHNEMRLRLESFREHLARLGESRDLESAVNELKQEGSHLTRMMRLHMAAEEKKFGSLEN